MEPPIMDTLKGGQPPYNGQTVNPLPIYCPYISTSTSEQWTKYSSPMCPLFRGCTVYTRISPITLSVYKKSLMTSGVLDGVVLLIALP